MKLCSPEDVEAYAVAQEVIYNAEVKALDFSHRQLEGLRARHTTFADSVFVETVMRNANVVDSWFPRVNAEGAEFSGATLTRSSFPRAVLRRARFVGANCNGVDFAGSDLTDVDFTDTNLEDAKFWYAMVTIEALQRSRNWDEIKHTVRGITHLLAKEAKTLPAGDPIQTIFTEAIQARNATNTTGLPHTRTQ
ncbi:MAG: pentapeptide repeat-containing protein [Acidimicrobiia bacterium]